jgi:hypothetical protein
MTAVQGPTLDDSSQRECNQERDDDSDRILDDSARSITFKRDREAGA